MKDYTRLRASYWPIFRGQYYPVVVVCFKIDILTKRLRSFRSATGICTPGDEVVLEISRLFFRLKLALVNVNYVFAHFNKVFRKVKGPHME